MTVQAHDESCKRAAIASMRRHTWLVGSDDTTRSTAGILGHHPTFMFPITGQGKFQLVRPNSPVHHTLLSSLAFTKLAHTTTLTTAHRPAGAHVPHQPASTARQSLLTCPSQVKPASSSTQQQQTTFPPLPSPNMSTPPRTPDHETLATEARPVTSATITVRVIKSFPFRTTKNLVLKELDLSVTTVGHLAELCREGAWAASVLGLRDALGWTRVTLTPPQRSRRSLGSSTTAVCSSVGWLRGNESTSR